MSLSGHPPEPEAGTKVPPASVRASVPAAPSAQSDWSAQINAELTFRLIDSILPFEACLYHQVLPLALEGSRLKLGMVSVDDTVALDYVRRIMGYMNCSLTPQAIDSDMHHAVLTAYLNYASTKARSKPPSRKISSPQSTAIDEHSTVLLESEASGVSEGAMSELFADHDAPTVLEKTISPVAATAPPATQSLKMKASPLKETTPPVEETAPPLEVTAQHLQADLEILADLPGPQLLDELLGRMLTGGIGRLYFERHARHGRILWSQNGVMQAVLEDLPDVKFEAAIAALKHLAHLPPALVTKPQYWELERHYQDTRLLLRLRLVPGTYGEEGNLQVLRGAALKFHQQQQVTMQLQESLTTAQSLQQQINTIRTRMQFYPVTTSEQQSILSTLVDLLKSVQQQIHTIGTMKVDPGDGDES
jgi:type II secretory ATPase GspE/PulE/Tfp pilus assembly ATPase PilB-like protein